MGEYLRHLYFDIGGKKIYAYRVALCSHRQYVADIFVCDVKSQTLPIEIKLQGISADAFMAFREFCDMGEMTVYPGISTDILIAAYFFKVRRALKRKREVILRNLPLGKCLTMMIRSKAHTSGKLYTILFRRVLEEFIAASVLDRFVHMDVDLFCRMIESDELVVASEFEVFTIAIRWITHDIEHRVKHTMRIMTLIRFYYMTQLELAMCVVKMNSLVRQCDKFPEIVLIANLMLTTDSLNLEHLFGFTVPKPRHCYRKPTDQIPAIEWNTTITSTNDVEYTTEQNKHENAVVGGFDQGIVDQICEKQQARNNFRQQEGTIRRDTGIVHQIFEKQQARNNFRQQEGTIRRDTGIVDQICEKQQARNNFRQQEGTIRRDTGILHQIFEKQQARNNFRQQEGTIRRDTVDYVTPDDERNTSPGRGRTIGTRIKRFFQEICCCCLIE